MSARRASQRTGSTDRLMRWRGLSQTTHATLVLVVAFVAMVAGLALAMLVTTSLTALVLFAGVWALILTAAVYAYAEAVIRR